MPIVTLEVEISRGLRYGVGGEVPEATSKAARLSPSDIDDSLEVRILRSPLDRPRERFVNPFEAGDLDSFLKTWDKLILKSTATDPEADDCRRVFHACVAETLSRKLFEDQELEDFFEASRRRKAGSPESECRELLARRVGEIMLAALFPGRLATTFDNCMEYRDRTTRLKIQIGFGDHEDYLPELIGAPWELLHWPKTRGFLSRGMDVQIIRYLDAVRRVLPLKIAPPLKVLAVFAAPTDQHPIDLEAHRRSLQEAMIAFPQVQIRFLMSATLDRLRKRLEKDSCHVLHFLGHGGFRDSSGEGILFFEEDDHSTRTVTGLELADALKVTDTLRLAVLTTCVGARMMRRYGHHPFTGTASALIADGLPAVIAMQFPISEAAASTFSSAFYPRLGKGLPVDLALAQARGAMYSTARDRPSFEWATPVLYLHSPDGKILDIKDTEAPPPKRIAIFTIRDIGRETLDIADLQIDLDAYFEDRFIRRHEDWNGIVPQLLTSQLDFAATAGNSYHFDFAALASIAFATGYLFEAKKAVRMQVTQRGINNVSTWDISDGAPPQATKWRRIPIVKKSFSWFYLQEPIRKFPWAKGSKDVALAISVTSDVLPALTKYLRRSDLSPPPPTIGTLIFAELRGGPSQQAIHNGGHAYQLVEHLCNRLHSYISGHDVETLHIFASAPNVIPFLMGRLSHKLGRIQLYEYDFKHERHGSYEPSIVLPSEASLDQ